MTPFNFTQKILEGSYYHLWYLYLLVGLYALTPMLRVLVKHLDRKLMGLLLALWFLGTVVPSFIFQFTYLGFDPVMVVLSGWVGYYLLGIYLVNVKIRRSIVYAVAAVGFLGSVLGDWAVEALMGEQFTGYFHHDTSFSIIFGSAAAFLLLISVSASKFEAQTKLNSFIHWVGKNTLPIFLIHPVFLELLSQNLLGFSLPSAGNLILDVPILTLATFALSSTAVFLLKKIPHVAKIIG